MTEHLRALLAQGGVFTAQQLQAATGKSQPSISLALNKLGAEVCKLGAARSTRYALTQPILGLPAQQTWTWTTPDGSLQTFGSLHFLKIGQVYMRSRIGQETGKGADWLSPPGQLPWFLQNLPTPVYDMLPMLWRPGVHGGELDTAPLQPQAQPAGYAALAWEVRAWAITYWERAASLPALSATLRAASGANAQQLQRGLTG